MICAKSVVLCVHAKDYCRLRQGLGAAGPQILAIENGSKDMLGAHGYFRCRHAYSYLIEPSRISDLRTLPKNGH